MGCPVCNGTRGFKVGETIFSLISYVSKSEKGKVLHVGMKGVVKGPDTDGDPRYLVVEFATPSGPYTMSIPLTRISRTKPEEPTLTGGYKVNEIVYSITNRNHATEPLRFGMCGQVIRILRTGRLQVQFENPAGLWTVVPPEISRTQKPTPTAYTERGTYGWAVLPTEIPPPKNPTAGGHSDSSSCIYAGNMNYESNYWGNDM